MKSPEELRDQDQKVIGHVPEALAFLSLTLMKEWKVYRVNATISGEKRKAPERTWVLGGGIEIRCKYFLYGSPYKAMGLYEVGRGGYIRNHFCVKMLVGICTGEGLILGVGDLGLYSEFYGIDALLLHVTF